MGWAKLTDRRAMNPKLRASGFAARGLDEAAICQIAADETDGVITAATVEMLAIAHREKQWKRLVEVLVRERRWEPCESGWIVKGYLKHNPSKADRDADRARKQAAGKLGGYRSGEARAKQAASRIEAESKHTASDAANSRPRTRISLSSSSSSRGSPQAVDDDDPGPEFYAHRLNKWITDPQAVSDTGEQALRILAGRDLERREAEVGKVGDRAAWLAAAVERRRAQHLSRLPTVSMPTTLTPERFADFLEPPPKPEPCSTVKPFEPVAAYEVASEAPEWLRARRETPPELVEPGGRSGLAGPKVGVVLYSVSRPDLLP